MYIRTPKKYRGPQRRSMIPCQRIFISLVLMMLIAVGAGLYQVSDMLRPEVNRVVGTAMVDLQGGVATLQAPPATATQNPTANLTQGDNAWAVGNIGSALAAYRQVTDALPNDVNVHYRMTMGLISMGNEQEALNYAERTVTADPFDPYGWAARAYVLSRVNDRAAEGVTSALQALDLDPENATAMGFLSLAYFALDQDQTAFNWANDAIEANPDQFAGYFARGLIYENSFAYLDPDAALVDFQVAYDLAQDQNPALAADVAVGIARIYERDGIFSGDFTEAVNTLESLLEFNPDHTGALNTLGRIHFVRRGDLNQALQPLQQCVDVDSRDVDCLYWLGRVQLGLENTTEALEVFLRLTDELNSTNGYHYYWAGQAHYALGACEVAARYWETGYQYAINGTFADDGILVPSYESLPSCANLTFTAPPTPTPIPEETEEAQI